MEFVSSKTAGHCQKNKKTENNFQPLVFYGEVSE